MRFVALCPSSRSSLLWSAPSPSCHLRPTSFSLPYRWGRATSGEPAVTHLSLSPRKRRALRSFAYVVVSRLMGVPTGHCSMSSSSWRTRRHPLPGPGAPTLRKRRTQRQRSPRPNFGRHCNAFSARTPSTSTRRDLIGHSISSLSIPLDRRGSMVPGLSARHCSAAHPRVLHSWGAIASGFCGRQPPWHEDVRRSVRDRVEIPDAWRMISEVTTGKMVGMDGSGN
jgi:hypothetical protein